MIPFAVLERVPSTLNEFEGIDINQADLRDVRFDPANLANELRRGAKPREDNSYKQVVKLLEDLDNTINEAEGVKPDIARQHERSNLLETNAFPFYESILGLMLAREMFVDRPKAKIVIRTQPSLYTSGAYDAIETAVFKIQNKGYKVFGLRDPYNCSFTRSEADVVRGFCR
jgi:hypothetical protein